MTTGQPQAAVGARYALAILFLINLLNFLDRNILAALLPLIQAEFGISDTAGGALGASFIWVFMLAAVPFGWLADRVRRTRIVAGGVAMWSAATAGSAAVPNFAALFVCRAFVGVGEAAYSAAAPTMIADLYAPVARTRALSVFYIAIPVGAGLGYQLGGYLGEALGWRGAFLVAGLPGLVFTVLAWRMREPVRGAFDRALPAQLPLRAAIRHLLGIRSYRWVVIGQILVTFVLGGVSVWLPTYFVRTQDMSLGTANLFAGGALIIGSLAGTWFGGELAHRWRARTRNALVYTIVLGLAISGTLLPVFFLLNDEWVLFPLLVVINFFLFWHTGPTNTLIANVAAPHVRAMAVSLQILLIHLLGDALSPTLIGAASDALQRAGLDEAAALRRVFLLMVPLPLLLAAASTLVAARWAPDDMAQVIGDDA